MYALGMRRIVIILALMLACDSRPPTAGLLDLNRATVAELEALPGIGPKKAHSIIASRNAHGGRFASWGEVLAIDGIGPETVAQLQAHATLR